MNKSSLLLLLMGCLFVFTSNKRGPIKLTDKVHQTKVFYVGEVKKHDGKRVWFENEAGKQVVINFHSIWSDLIMPSHEGKQLIMSETKGKYLSARNLVAVFKVIDDKILISHPYFTNLKKAGWAAEETLHNEFRGLLCRNKSTNAIGATIELNRFLSISTQLKETKDLESLKQKYTKGSFEYAMCSL